MSKIENRRELHPKCEKSEGYKETEVCFLDNNTQVLDSAYPLSDEDKYILECMDKELKKQRIDAILEKLSTPYNSKRKRHIEQSINQKPQSDHQLSLLDISLIAVQISFALSAVITLLL